MKTGNPIERYVVDCSVAVKWFVPERMSEAAERIRFFRSHLHIPELFLLEFGSAVLNKIRRRELAVAQALEIIGEIRRIPMQKHRDETVFPLAFEVASKTAASLYDCMYIALATDIDGLVITADRRLLRAVAGTEFAEYALWIEDLPAA